MEGRKLLREKKKGETIFEKEEGKKRKID